MYQQILVPIDGSPTSDLGLEQAIALAKLTGGSIRLMHVLDELVFVTGFEIGATYANTVLPALRKRSEGILAAGRERVAAAAVPVETLTSECFARRPVRCHRRAGGRMAGRPDRPWHARPARHQPHAPRQRCRAGCTPVVGAGPAREIGGRFDCGPAGRRSGSRGRERRQRDRLIQRKAAPLIDR